TTIVSSTNSGMARSTRSMPCSSFRHGMMTVMDWDLYMGVRLFPGAARLITRNGNCYHDKDEAGLVGIDGVGFVRAGCGAGRRPEQRTRSVLAEHGPWAGAVPGQ